MSQALGSDDLLELYEHAPCGYLCARPDGTIVRVNETFEQMTGYQRAALVPGTRFQDLLTTACRIFYENQYAPLLTMQGYVREVALDISRPGRDALPVLVNSVQRVDDSGQPRLIATTLFDATDRRTYERELLVARRRAERLAAIVTAANDAILTVSADRMIATWNPGATRLFGYQAAEVIGRRLDQVLPEVDAILWPRGILAALAAVKHDQTEIVVRGSDGQAIELSVGSTPHARGRGASSRPSR